MVDYTRLRIPTPFSIGRVNCYVFSENGLTLLDPGPKTEEAYDLLESHLDQTGHALADVDRVLITHPHMDHYGLAGRIQRESGAEVVAHEDAVEQLVDPDGFFEREQRFFVPFFESMGVPTEIADTVVELPEPYTDFREPVTVDRPIHDGDVVDVGGELTAIDTPGHSPGSACFVADDVVFTGDHVMMEISPNPLLTLAPGTTDERTRSLPLYLDSLERMADVEPTVGCAGHRGRIPNVQQRAAEIATHHHERKENIAEMIAEESSVTAYRIMQRMFPDLPVTETFPGMSEVIGHLDLLEDERRVEITDVDSVRQYRLR